MKPSPTIPNYDWGNYQKILNDTFNNKTSLQTIFIYTWKKRVRNDLDDVMDIEEIKNNEMISPKNKKHKVEGIFGGLYYIIIYSLIMELLFSYYS
jgi:hypothetical protein